jgi:twinkle protein
MLIPKEKIIDAKTKLGDQAALIILEDLKLEKFDEKNLKGICPFHNEDTGSFVWFQEANTYKCFGCGTVYDILDHYMSFYKLTYLDAVAKLFKQVGIDYRFGEKGVKSDRKYRYPYREYSEDRTAVETYLEKRGISKNTLDYADIQQDKHGNIAFHFYDLNDVLTMVKYRPSKEIQKGDTKSWCQEKADTKNLLYNINRVDPTKPLVITEGELDCLSVIEAGYTNAVSIPLGAGNTQWIELNWDFLEQFQKIIIWSDNDAPGINMRKEVCARLGTWRSFYVDLPTEKKSGGKIYNIKDANDVLVNFGKQSVLNLIDTAVEIPVEDVTDLSEVPDFDLESAPGLYSGIDQLNTWINKFVLGTVVILTGRNGNGKSVLLNQMFITEPLNQGMDVFLYSAEMGKPLLKNWIELVMAGRENVTLLNNTVHKINPEATKKMRKWYKDRIFVYDNDKDLSANHILDRLETVVRRFGVKVAVLDNLLTIDLGISSGQEQALWEEQKKFVIKLVNFAAKYGILIVLVVHPRKVGEYRRLTTDDIGGSGNMTNLVHYVLSVHRYSKAEKEGEKGSGGNYKKGKEPIPYDCVIDLFKNRISGHANKEVKLYFDYPSYRFYTKPEELYKRYKWDQGNQIPIPKTDPNEHLNLPDFMEE